MIEISDDVVVACEPQDFDEMAGNLMENAFKWARGRVAIRAMPDLAMTRLVIEDDGPGLRPEEIEKVLRPGERLDESAPGFGFGLSITRELAELYGGSVEFGASDSRRPAGVAAFAQERSSGIVESAKADREWPPCAYRHDPRSVGRM